MLVAPTFSAVPYPGLRPFETYEQDIFFGRERQTDELLAKLQRHRFLAIVGPSGCGKSSLVRAGLIASLETGFMADAGSRWRVAQMRPGDRPMQRLAESLLPLVGPDRAAQPDAALFLEAALSRGPLGLLELAEESRLCGDGSLLVLVDQFEEVFRFRRQGDPDEADAFVALMLATAQSSLPIYVILTMRSDFLGDCSVFRDLPEAINRSTYLIPRLTREQCGAAIAGPARVFQGEVEPALVNRLLNDFGPDPDQLPLLQHALMRMWFQRTGGVPTSLTVLTVLSVQDYERIGGLSNALSDHADEILRELSPDRQRIARVMFQRLTERAPGKRDTRAAARIGEIARIAEVPAEQVAAVVDAFRGPGRSFLTPFEGPLEADALIDIGHESLIRQWKQLAAWVEAEADSATTYGRLRDTARLWEAGQAGLWRDPDLTRATEWKARANPNEGWAARYGSSEDFTRALRFLDASEAEHRLRVAQLRMARERALRRARRVAWTLAAMIAAIAVGATAYWYGWIREYKAYYNSFTKVNGVPIGIGELSSQQAHRRWSIKLVRAGRFGSVRRVEAVDDRGGLTPGHSVGTYVSETADVAQRREVRWEFLYDADGRVVHEVAYDRSGHRVWAFMYSPPNPGDDRIRLAHFVGPDGYTLQTRGYGGGFVRIRYSPEGYDELVTYTNHLGQPRVGLDNAFGRRYTYDSHGNATYMVSVGPDGKPMVDEAGNAGLRMKPDRSGNIVEYVATDADGKVTTVRDGWAIARASYDENGNRIALAYFGEHGESTLHREGYHRYSRVLDDRGNTVEEWYWLMDGSPAFVEGCHGRLRTYDERGNLLRDTCAGPGKKPAPADNGVTTSIYTYDSQDNVLSASFTDGQDRPVFGSGGYSQVVYKYDERGNRIETAYLGTKGEPVPTRSGYSAMKSVYDAHNNETARTYFGTDGKPIVFGEDRDDRVQVGATLTYARLERRYDENGNRVHEAYFDVNGKPMLGPDGYAAWQATYDLSGNRIEVAYRGVHGEPVLSLDGYAGWRPTYDALGREIEVRFFGLRGEPVLSTEHAAGWTSTYDAHGNETERRFFGVDGRPAVHARGYAGYRARFDRSGQAIAFDYLGIHGEPVLIPWDRQGGARGFARDTRQYDARRRILEHTYFGADGSRVRRPEGWSRVVNRYELRGSDPIDTRYYDVDDRPVMVSDGYAEIKRQLDVYGRVIEESFYDTRGSLVRTRAGYARALTRYDSYGRPIERAAFGPDLAPVVVRAGFHKVRERYDVRGQLLERRYLGPGDVPARLWGTLQHLTRFRHDDRGHVIEITNFGPDGSPCLGPDPSNEKLCTRWIAKYDDGGKLLSSKCEAGGAR
jgi:hypothetical protein